MTAKGQTLTVKLLHADPTFVAQLSMPFFAAVKPNMAIDPKGISVYPSAGPYKIVSRDPGRSLVLERNTFYKGTRPANADQHRLHDEHGPEPEPSAGQVGRGQLRPRRRAGVQNGPLSDEFGVNKSRYFVNPLTGTGYIAMNTATAPFNNLKARQAATGPSTARRCCARAASSEASAPTRSWRLSSRASRTPTSTRSRARTRRRRSRSTAVAATSTCCTRPSAAAVELRPDREVQPRAGGLQGHPEAAAVRCCNQVDGHQGHRPGHVRDRLDR